MNDARNVKQQLAGLVKAINRVAKVDFDTAKIMLEMVNERYNMKFGFLAKRVVWYEDTGKYEVPHDAYCYLEEPA